MEIIILENRKEFTNSIRNEFIPMCIKANMKEFVLLNQRDMFTKWDSWFDSCKSVTYKGSKTHELIIKKDYTKASSI